MVVNKSVLVTGSSGYIGRNLVSTISPDLKSLVAMYRQRIPDPVSNSYPVCLDLRNSDLLGAPLREIDTVVHLAWDDYGGEYGQNLELVRNLVSKMEEIRTRKLIILSHSGASSDTKESFLRSKYEIEKIALNSNLPKVVIIRSPVAVSGKEGEDPFLTGLLNLLRVPLIYPVPIPESNKIDLISLAEVIEKLKESILVDVELDRVMVEMDASVTVSVEVLLGHVSKVYKGQRKFGLKWGLGKQLLRLMNRLEGPSAFNFSDYIDQGRLFNTCSRSIEKSLSTGAGPTKEQWTNLGRLFSNA